TSRLASIVLRDRSSRMGDSRVSYSPGRGLGAATARMVEGDRMDELPRVRFAHIGGSGTWGFRYPDGSLDGHPYLSVQVADPDIRVETPYGPSPSFRRCRITDGRTGAERDYLYVWMHGI